MFKKSFIAFACCFSFLNAGFISEQISNHIGKMPSGGGNIGSIISGGGINTENLGGILKNYGSQYLNEAFNMGQDSLLNNSDLSKYLGENSLAYGAMSMCYDYKPSSSNVTGNICSMFNDANVDLCSALPERIGNWYKKASTDLSFTIGLKDWCNKLAGETINRSLSDILKDIKGISGKEKVEVAESVFLNDENGFIKKQKDALSSIVSIFNSKLSNTDTAGQKRMKELAKNGQEAVVLEKLNHIADSSDGKISEDDTKAMKHPTIAFESYKEYKDDVEYIASSDFAQENNVLDFSSFLDIANELFNSYNTQNKTLADKIAWINSEVAKREKELQFLAHKKAREEIIYTLPDKLGYYHILFNKDIIKPKNNHLNLSNNAKKEIINSEIRKQEWYESRIQIKWALWAKKKSVELKNMLIKAAIASEVFPRDAVENEINAMIGES